MKALVIVIGNSAQSLTNLRAPLLKAIAARGHRVIAISPGLDYDQAAVATLAGWNVEARGVAMDRTGINPFSDLRLMRALTTIFRDEQPDAVLNCTAKPAIFGTLAASTASVPRRYAMMTGLGYAFTAGSGRARGLVRFVLKNLYHIAFRRAQKVFFQNQDDAQMFRDMGLIPPNVPAVIVSGSGIDLEHFAPVPWPAGPLRFLLIARLLSAKGIREYAEAARLVRNRHPDVEFHLIGGVDINPDAIAASEVKGWTDAGYIIWHGEVADVRPHLASSHVYVLPSYREGTSRSTLEAMAMARAIITTDAPGCRETVIEGENGFMVPPQTVEPLAEAMRRFVDNPSIVEPMGRRSREIAESRFDAKIINAQMLREMELA